MIVAGRDSVVAITSYTRVTQICLDMELIEWLRTSELRYIRRYEDSFYKEVKHHGKTFRVATVKRCDGKLPSRGEQSSRFYFTVRFCLLLLSPAIIIE